MFTVQGCILYMRFLNKGISVVGSTTIDQIVTENQSAFKLGGVTTYSGITYRRHGIDTLIVSNLAEQDLGIIDKLHEEKIVVCREETEFTTHFVNYIKGDTRYQELPRQAKPIEARQIQAILNKIDALHLGPLHPLDIELEALDLLHNSDLAIFLDAQGYTRMVKNKNIYPFVSEHMATGLSIAQIIKANAAELKIILDYYQISLAELMLRFKIDEFVVTLGANGGFVQKQSGDAFQYAADIVKSPIDPTGAGDVFFAAYNTSRFSNQMQIPDACRYAARIAAQQVEGKFITNDQLSLMDS
jgi:sugar/nucleoside kinase (ribokinase family)